jgi:hypothetical protein
MMNQTQVIMIDISIDFKAVLYSLHAPVVLYNLGLPVSNSFGELGWKVPPKKAKMFLAGF